PVPVVPSTSHPGVPRAETPALPQVVLTPAVAAPAPAAAHGLPRHRALRIGSIEVQIVPPPPAAPTPMPAAVQQVRSSGAAQASSGTLARGYLSSFGIRQG